MTPETIRNRKIAIVAVIVAILIGAVATLLVFSNKDDQVPVEENNKQDYTIVTYNGFGELSQYGLTELQMDGVKAAFHKHKQTAEVYTINTATIQESPYDSDNPTDFTQLSFDIKIDDVAYKAVIDKYVDLMSIDLHLTNASTQTKFDSGKINAGDANAIEDEHIHYEGD